MLSTKLTAGGYYGIQGNLLMPIKIKFADFADKANKAIKAKYDKSLFCIEGRLGVKYQEILVYSSNTCNATFSLLVVYGNGLFGRYYEVNCTAAYIFNQYVNLIESNNVDSTMFKLNKIILL